MELTDTHGITDTEDTFPTLRKRLARFLDQNHPEYDPDNPYALDALLDLPDLNFALELFFTEDFFNRVKTNHVMQTQLPETYPEIKLSKPYTTFMSAACPHSRMSSNLNRSNEHNHRRAHIPTKPQRKTEIYPLTMEQTESALLFLQKNDDYLFAVNAIKMCLKDYIQGVRGVFENQFGLKVTMQIAEISYTDSLTQSEKSLRSGFDGLKNNAESFVFTHDLAMQIAATLMTQDIPFSESSMTESVRGLFQMQSFQSAYSIFGDNKRDFKQCPFKDAVIDMLRTKLEPQEDGSLKAIRSQQHGQLILDIRNLVRERYFQAWSPPWETGPIKRKRWPD